MENVKLFKGDQTMNTKKLLFYTLAVLLGGCVPSLHPLYTSKDLVFNEKLLGTWADNENRWAFQKGTDPNSYKLAVTDEKGKGQFIAYLVKIDNMLFLDLFPEEPKLEHTSDFYKIHLVGVHTFIKVEQIEPVLKVRLMNPEKIEKMLEDDPNLLKHEKVKDRIILTASPKELQKFMKKYANVYDVFGDPGDLKRVEPE
jgi:hypothetical protein